MFVENELIKYNTEILACQFTEIEGLVLKKLQFMCIISMLYYKSSYYDEKEKGGKNYEETDYCTNGFDPCTYNGA
jgi:hypothetical protein